MFQLIQAKTKQLEDRSGRANSQSNNVGQIVSDSIKRSIFGVFSQNYSKFKKDKNEIEVNRS